MPDAFIFVIHDNKKVKYYGKKITIDEVINNKDYKFIDAARKAYLYLHNDYLSKDSIILDSLIRHYENYYNHEINVAAALRKKLKTNAAVITSDYYGFGLQYLSMTNNIKNTVQMLPEGKEAEFIRSNNINIFYSINKTYEGYNSKLVHQLNINKNNRVNLYLNTVK